jgi:predicted amidophosphoribosyltransferase
MEPAPGLRDFPPKRRPRFEAPVRRCPHCDLPSATTDTHCPVCAARFEPTRRERLLRALRRAAGSTRASRRRSRPPR